LLTTDARWLIKGSKDVDFHLVFFKETKIEEVVGFHLHCVEIS